MSNIFGQLLNLYHTKKQMAIQSAKDTLQQRNGVDYRNDQAFKLDEREVALPDGKTVTEIRLWKLVDAVVVSVDPEVKVETKDGITALGDFHADPNHPLYVDPTSLQDRTSSQEVAANCVSSEDESMAESSSIPEDKW